MTSNKKLYNEFLEEQIKIIPSLNDSLNLNEFELFTIDGKSLFDYQEKELHCLTIF